MHLNVVTQFSYCMETIIQAGNKRLRISSVPITTNPKTRESRLFKNIWHHMGKSGQAISRSYIMFKPHTVFVTLGMLFLVAALIPFVRFLVLWIAGTAGGHIQSLIFGTAMLVGSLLCFALLVIADLQKTNRVLLEETLERLKEIQYGTGDLRAALDDHRTNTRPVPLALDVVLPGALGGDGTQSPSEVAAADEARPAR
jgi:hypothetical protein